MPDATFAAPDLTTFAHLDLLGLEAVGQRLEAARNRLETSDDTLDRVASACGFGTVDTLARAFRKALGVTPGEYRKRFSVV